MAAFAAVAYAWVIGCLSIAAGLVAWLVPQLVNGRFRFGLAWMLLAALGLLWVSLRALWVRFEAPDGLMITAQQAPALFETLERIRQKIHGPPIHAVYLDDDFNAHDVRPLYELALQRSAEHPAALQGLARTLAGGERAALLQVLQRLWDAGHDYRWWAACQAVEALEATGPDRVHDAAALKLWRERRKQAQQGEERAWEELQQTPYFSQVARHDLSAFELGEVRAELARCKPVARAWLVCKTLREFPRRRAYLAFVDLPGMSDEDRYELCRWLERNLSLPGPALVLWAGESPTLDEIRRGAFEPVYPDVGGS